MKHCNFIATFLLIAAGSTAQASTVTLLPSASTVAQNGAFTVNLLLNAADAPGGHPGLFGGEIIVDFNKTLLTYGTFTLASGVTYFPVDGGPVVETNGNTQTVRIAFENAGDVGTVGTFSFTAIGTPGSLATIGLADADDFSGSFANTVPTDQRFYPSFTGTQVTISAVPLPASVWLLGTAVGGGSPRGAGSVALHAEAVAMRAGAIALALLLAATSAPAQAPDQVPAQDPDWHIPLAPATAGDSQQPDAVRLRDALVRYHALAAAGGWPELPAGASLEPGQRDARVVALRNRLRVSGDYEGGAGTADAWYFDARLQRAVQDFQARHGLAASGALDERTQAALNVPVSARVQQLQIALTRWNWLPRDLGARYLWANVPGASLELVENGSPTLAMRIIAGHPERPTPSFADTVSQIVVNPSWSVPRRIAVEDLLPTEQEDPTFLARLGIRVFSAGGDELDPARIDWARVSADHFPYRLRQDPGPLNSLGRLKFVLRNPWDIYLHDTPSRRLFDLNSRTLSSGCLRLEKPEELAERLLGAPVGAPSGATAFPRESSPRVSSGKAVAPEGAPTTTVVTLARPIPIYVVYLTSWVTPAGVVNFRPDVYGRDVRLR